MILVSTSNLTFGNVVVGEEEILSITIFNNSAYDVNITNVVSDSHFVVDGTALVPGNGSILLDVKLVPSNEIPYAGTLTISNDDPADLTDDIVNLSGAGIKPKIGVDLTSLNFSTVAIQDTKDLDVVVTNTDDDATLSITNILFDNSDYTTSTTSFNLNPGQSKIVPVSFSPTSVGIAITGTMTIENNSSNDETLDISLTGVGEVPVISVSPLSINFGNVTLNDTEREDIVVSNNSLSDINLRLNNVSIDNSIFKETISTFILAKDEALNIPITFSPVDTSPQTGTLTIESNDTNTGDILIPLSGVGIAAPNIQVLTSNINFGMIGIGNTSDKILRIINSGVLDLSISNIVSSNSMFTISPISATISPSDFFEFTITYTPIAAVTDTGHLTITSNDPDTPVLEDVTLLGSGGISILELITTSLNFGNVGIGDTLEKTISIRNSGQASLIVSGTTVDNSKFVVTSSFPISVSVGNTASIGVNFSPDMVGSETGILSIQSNDLDNPSQDVNLSGAGVIADISISPSSLSFGNVAVDSSKSLEVTISNIGQATLNISSITSSDSHFVPDKSSMTISPNQSNSLEVNFFPDAVGTFSGNITLENNDPGEPNLIINVTGNGALASISVDTTALSFGSLAINDSKTISLPISNIGVADLEVTVGAGIALYDVDPSFLTIVGGGSSSINVTFTPNAIGVLNSILTLQTNDTSNLTVTIDLLGSGGDLPKISLNRTSIDFTEVAMNQSKARVFIISNDGTQDLTYAISIDTNPVFMATLSSGTISAGGSETITVTFVPDTTGNFSATLTITSNDPNNSPSTMLLSGTGAPGALQWIPFNPIDSIPDEIVELGQSISDILDPLAEALDTLSSILDTIKSFIISISDPIKVLLEAIKQGIEDLRQDLAGIGVYVLPVLPGDKRISYEKFPQLFRDFRKEKVKEVFGEVSDFFNNIKGGSKVFTRKLVDSFDDPGDGRRPQFSDTAYVGGYVIAADSGDLGNILEFAEKIATLFNVEFKAQFTPPSNVTAIASNDKVKITFSANDGLLPNAYLIWRSTEPGGDVAEVSGEKAKERNSGRELRSYHLREVLKFTDLISEAFNISTTQAESWITQANGYIRGLLGNLQQLFAMKFFFEDENIETGTTYFYTISAAFIDRNSNPDDILALDIYSDQLVDRIYGDNNKVEKKREDTGILVNGPFSTEVSATPVSVFQADLTGIARCRNFRCTLEEENVEEFTRLSLELNLEYEPLRHTLIFQLKRKIETEDIATGNILISYNLDIISKGLYKVVGNRVTFLNAKIFQDGDILIATYKHIRNLEEKQIDDEEDHNVVNNSTFNLEFSPVDPTSINMIETQSRSTLVNGTDYEVLDELRSLIKISTQRFGDNFTVIVDYTYLKGLSDDASCPSCIYKCINPEYHKYYFSFVTCDNGTTECPGYKNANCFFNNGERCSVNDDSGIELELDEPEQHNQIPNNREITLKNGNVISSSVEIEVDGENITLEKDVDFFIIDTTNSIISVNSSQLQDLGIDKTFNFLVTYKYGNIRRSSRKVITFENNKRVVKDENISFEEFWDPIACQNGTMAQRCDGYTLSDPRPGYKGTPPDWISVRVVDIFPFIDAILETMENIIDSLLAGTEKLTDTLVNFINLIQEKIDNLRRFVDKIQNLLDVLVVDFNIPGLYILEIPFGVGGNEYLKTSIQNATDGPDSDITGYTIGAAFIAGGPSSDNEALQALKRALEFLF